MPEGPETKLFGEALAHRISSKYLVSVEIISGRYTRQKLSGLDKLILDLPIKIIGIGVHGKFIYWLTSSNHILFNSLGMTGHWGDTLTKHARIKFNFDDNTCVYFSDTRNFGTIQFVHSRNDLQKKLRSLGPDMLTQNITLNEFCQRLRKFPDKEITEVLMDQKVIAGVGNYIKSEALWAANISPLRKVRTLSDTECENLKNAIQNVMSKSYQYGGTTLKDYRQFDNKQGQYTFKLAVYNKQQDPNGYIVVKTQTADGRSTYWVPQVQK